MLEANTAFDECAIAHGASPETVPLPLSLVRTQQESHRVWVEAVHRRFVAHLLNGASLLPSWMRRIEQLSICRQGLVLVSRSRPEGACCVELRAFPVIATRLRELAPEASVGVEISTVDEAARGRIVARVASRIYVKSCAEPVYVLASQTESALGASKPRRLSLTLCYHEAALDELFDPFADELRGAATA